MVASAIPDLSLKPAHTNLSSVNLKLRPKILSKLKPGTRVVSYNYGMGEWQADKTT